MFYTTDMPGEQSWILSTTEQVHLNDVHEGLRFGGGPLQNIMRLNRHPATLTALGRSATFSLHCSWATDLYVHASACGCNTVRCILWHALTLSSINCY